jgi:predicted RNA-binding Zn-ribbon protein involved in translation (DUF1610 family)
LLPHLAGVLVEGIVTAGAAVRIRCRARGTSAACPSCGTVSGRVHSRYERQRLDTAAAGQEMVIGLTVRRFFCPDPGFVPQNAAATGELAG